MKKSFIKLFLFIGMLFVGLSTSYADDGFTFSISGAKDVKPGDSFDVNVTVKGPSTEYVLHGYDLKVEYDSSKLSIVGGENGVVNLKTSTDPEIDTEKVIIVLRVSVNSGATSGDTTLKLSGSYQYNDETKTKGFNSGTISIRSIETDSSLKSLKIPNTVLSPSFDKSVHEYTATVTDVTAIDIKAEPTSAHSVISVTPNASSLVKGENDITIVCQSENGAQSTYTIKVTLNLTPTEEELKAQDTTLKSLSIKGQKIDFSSTEKKYYINVDYDTTKLTVNATPTNEKAEVAITGNTKLIVGKNTVKVTITSEDKTKTDTYQIMVTRAEEEKEVVKTCPDETSSKEWIIFTIALILTFTLGIVLGYFLCRKEVFSKLFKKKKTVEEPVEISTLSDTIDLSNTVHQTTEEISKVEEPIETIDSEK